MRLRTTLVPIRVTNYMSSASVVGVMTPSSVEVRMDRRSESSIDSRWCGSTGRTVDAEAMMKAEVEVPAFGKSELVVKMMCERGRMGNVSTKRSRHA